MDRDKTPLDPYKNDPAWILSGCVATLFLFRVVNSIRLEALQAKQMQERQSLVDKQQRVRMTLLEHKRKD